VITLVLGQAILAGKHPDTYLAREHETAIADWHESLEFQLWLVVRSA
jgi:hypothetical protein